MPIEPGVWGIDLGQCALKALRVENIDGQVTATAFDYVEHPKILSQPDADPDQLTREALEKFLSRNSLRGDQVVISIPGQSGLARFVKLPPVEEKKIPDIVRFEAKQQIPFNLEEVVWDYQKIGSGAVTDGFAMETEIGLFAIKRETVNRYLQHFKDVNVEVHVVQMAPLALCNFLAYDRLEKADGQAEGGKKRCLVALDIGTDSSNLVITDGQRIIWQRPIPLGGNHFTRALTKDMKLTFAKAEHLKRNATKSPDLKQILSSLKPVLNDFVGEVQRSLGYFTNTHRDASVQYLIGLGSAFRLPGLQKFLSEKLQLEVHRLQKLERLAGDEVVTAPVFTENVLSFAVAYGLAIQGLGVGRLHTNLLPQNIRVERMIRAKKPWAVAAASLLLLGTSVMGMGYNLQYRSYAAPVVGDALKNGKSVVGTAQKYESDYKKVQEQIESDRKAVKSINIGHDERLNWLKLNLAINDALPRPDGSNLADDVKPRYITPAARRAYEYFSQQWKGTAKGGDKAEEERWRDDLIHVNIESMFPMFANDLPGYFNTLKGDKDHADIIERSMSKDDLAKPPEGAGWVVELHGYTYHRDGPSFLTDALVRNLSRYEKKPSAEGDQTPPANTNATPTAAPKADANPSTDNKAPVNTDDPVTGNISHVCIYHFWPDEEPAPGQFHILGNRVIESLLGGGGGGSGGGMGGMGAMMGKMGMMKGGPDAAAAAGGDSGTPSTPQTNNWTPLFGSGGSGGGNMAGPMGGPMGGPGGKFGAGGLRPGGGVAGEGAGRQDPSRMMKNMMGTMGARMGGGQMGKFGTGAPFQPGSGDQGMPDDPKKRKAKHMRTEFIILLIWKEPTPSDELRPPPDATPQ
jgi:type IV pilus assembly protein PilM